MHLAGRSLPPFLLTCFVSLPDGKMGGGEGGGGSLGCYWNVVRVRELGLLFDVVRVRELGLLLDVVRVSSVAL